MKSINTAIIFLTMSLIPVIGKAQEHSLPSRCESAAVHKIEVPIYNEKNSPTFTYRFSVSEREDKEAPLLLFIPGGPGQTSMDAALPYPYEYAVIRTDPRGLGCNENSKIPTDSLSSEAIARDLIAIIRELKPKRYFVHGISHGTMVATIFAKLVAEENLTQPEAVILEGVIGRAYKPNEYVDDVLLQWKRVKAKLPVSLQKSLEKKIPFKLSVKDWSAWLSSILAYGILSDGSDFAYDQLMLLDPSADADDREVLGNNIKRMLAAPPTKEKLRLYKEIACREFVPDVRDMRYDFSWSKGDLIVINDRLCKDMPFDRPFDSKDYQAKAPLYYFSGGMDPVTPPSQALYHFENQAAPRTLISVKRGGHNSLSANLFDCLNSFWLGMLKNNKSVIEKSLESCSLHSDITIKTVN